MCLCEAVVGGRQANCLTGRLYKEEEVWRIAVNHICVRWNTGSHSLKQVQGHFFNNTLPILETLLYKVTFCVFVSSKERVRGWFLFDHRNWVALSFFVMWQGKNIVGNHFGGTWLLWQSAWQALFSILRIAAWLYWIRGEVSSAAGWVQIIL